VTSAPAPAGTTRRAAVRAARKPSRREQVLVTAERLFTEHGFPGTGIDDIGAAAGVTGPAIYYYFRTKHELLAAVLTRLTEELYEASLAVTVEGHEPAEVLRRLAVVHVEHVFDHRALIGISVAEQPNMAAVDLGSSVATERSFLDLWVKALRQARPELDARSARSVAFAAQWLAYGVSFTRIGDTPTMRRRYVDMTMAVLGAHLAEPRAGNGRTR